MENQFALLRGKTMPALNERFGVSRGVCFADSVVVIWKLTARHSLSETPPERQAAGRYLPPSGQRSANWLSDRIKMNKFK